MLPLLLTTAAAPMLCLTGIRHSSGKKKGDGQPLHPTHRGQKPSCKFWPIQTGELQPSHQGCTPPGETIFGGIFPRNRYRKDINTSARALYLCYSLPRDPFVETIVSASAAAVSATAVTAVAVTSTAVTSTAVNATTVTSATVTAVAVTAAAVTAIAVTSTAVTARQLPPR